MVYNYNFAIAGLAILLLITYNFFMHRHLDNIYTKIFKILLYISILDIILDIITALLLDVSSKDIIVLNVIFLTIFYILQVLFPFLILCYIQSLKGKENMNMHKLLKKWCVFPVTMIVIIILNLFTGCLFYFDALGERHTGPLYLLPYIHTLLLVAIVILDTTINFRKYGWRNIANIWQYLILAAVCVSIQAVNNYILTTSFGIGLGMLVLFTTINNPYEQFDSMTSTFNNRYFINWLEELLTNEQEFHVINIYICNLKKINLVFGAKIGDRFLSHLANRLHDLVKHDAYIFRTNGNGFSLVIRSLSSYQRLKAELCQLASDDFEIDGQHFNAKIIVCGVHYANELMDVDNLVAYSDYLIQLANQEDGRILIEKNTETVQGYLVDRKVEQYLSNVIADGNVELYFQPIYSLKAEKYVSLEALSRICHPTLGYVPADKFISIAEKNGSILQLGLMQLHKICRFIKANPVVLDLIDTIKINFSPIQLMKADYCQRMIEIIRSYGLECSRFQIEIIETVATEYNYSLHHIIQQLSDAGIAICLDDFGNGYANLNTVLELPFNTVKLDRSLLSGICDNPKAASFYRNISGSLLDMGYNVVAEGVETAQELEFMQNWNIDYIQGYYFSKPVSETAILNVLTSGRASRRSQ